MDVALGAGADDYRDEGDTWAVYTPMGDLDNVTAAFEAAQVPIQQSRLAYIPKSKKTLSGRDAEVCLNLAEALDDHDDSQMCSATSM